jgi:uncharacterized membrane protein
VTLSPLLNAAPLVQLHAFAAMGACALGALQLFAPKGTIPHRSIGWIRIALMVVMLVTAFLNHNLVTWNLVTWDPFSPNICCQASEACARGSMRCALIHLLSLSTLLFLPFAVLQARLNNIMRHRQAMMGLFLLMVLGAAFTLLPRRIMHNVAFGLSALEQSSRLENSEGP